MAATQSTTWMIFSHVLLILTVVTPQPKTDLSFYVTERNTNKSTYFNFPMEKFERFYNCLCSHSKKDICKAHNNPLVLNITSCSTESNSSQIPFICQQDNKDLVCERRPALGNITLDCVPSNMFLGTEEEECVDLDVPIQWDSSQNVTVHSYSPNITYKCTDNCTSINMSLISKTPTTATKSPVPDTTSFPITSLQTNTTSTISANTTLLTDASTTSESTVSVSTTAPASDKTTYFPTKAVRGDKGEGENGNESILIIGVSVGVAVVAVMIVIIVIILWRRRMKQPSSSTNKSNDTDDETDIYPYGPSTHNNIKPKESKNKDKSTINGHGLSSNPASSSTPGGFENANASIDAQYAMVDLSAKRKNQAMGAYPNPYEEASPDIANQYTLVDLSAKNKPKSTTNTTNSSRYEEAYPDTVVQHSAVGLSAKNKPKPANDVYAKLHDPARNITNVYNQLPATDNAGQ